MKHTISVRLDENDLEKLATKATEMGLTSSTLARLLIRDSLSSSQSPPLALRNTSAKTLGTSVEEPSKGVEAPLSHRQTQILSMIAEGQKNSRIAHSLGISQETVKKDLAGIVKKLSASDRTHAVVLAIRRGHIRPTGNLG